MAVYIDENLNDPAKFFNIVTWTGDIVDGDGTGHDQAITGVGFQPDLIWHKCRSHANQNIFADSVRGTGGSPTQMLGLSSQDPGAETSANTNGWLESIDSDGYTVTSGNDSSSKSNNAGADGRTYVAWCWKESATAGFDIVAYTGNATNRTISHSLSAIPDFMAVKCRSAAARGWTVWHETLAGTHAVDFNLTDAQYESTGTWNSTTPTSSVFSVGTRLATNDDTETFIAYLFTSKQGFSKFGSYTGNGNADGSFVYTGFRPAFILSKNSDASTNWQMLDSKRDTFNPVDNTLYPDGSYAEANGGDIDFLSNGFKVRNSTTDWNTSGETIIYMAFAEAPLVNSNGVPCNAR